MLLLGSLAVESGHLLLLLLLLGLATRPMMLAMDNLMAVKARFWEALLAAIHETRILAAWVVSGYVVFVGRVSGALARSTRLPNLHHDELLLG